VTRGTAAPGSSCADAGTLTLYVSLPPASTYRLEELGVYFRVVGGEQPDEIFSDRPLTGTLEAGRMRFLFVWLDGHPSQQRPLDLRVEAFLVAPDLSIGPSTTFVVRGDPGDPERGP